MILPHTKSFVFIYKILFLFTIIVVFILAIKLVVRLHFSHGVLVWLVKPTLHSHAVTTYSLSLFFIHITNTIYLNSQ